MLITKAAFFKTNPFAPVNRISFLLIKISLRITIFFQFKFEYYGKKVFSLIAPSEGHVVSGESAAAKDTAVYGKCCCKGRVN